MYLSTPSSASQAKHPWSRSRRDSAAVGPQAGMSAPKAGTVETNRHGQTQEGTRNTMATHLRQSGCHCLGRLC